jgi:hypothetical protein
MMFEEAIQTDRVIEGPFKLTMESPLGTVKCQAYLAGITAQEKCLFLRVFTEGEIEVTRKGDDVK